MLVSGGGMIRDEELLDKVRIAMSAGATGLIFGRNMWQSNYKDALEMTS